MNKKFSMILALTLLVTMMTSSLTALANSSNAMQYPELYKLDQKQIPAELRLPPMKTVWNAANKDIDSDGDGLSDHQEIYKYGTDPFKKDSDGDGIPDGDWNERKEYAYTVTNIIEFIGIPNLEEMNDDYQDARIVNINMNHSAASNSELDAIMQYDREKYNVFSYDSTLPSSFLIILNKDNVLNPNIKGTITTIVEVVQYPYNGNGYAIESNRNWKQDYASMKEWLSPGLTTTYDAKMTKDIIDTLAKRGIRIDRMTDKQVVEAVSKYLLNEFTAVREHSPISYFVTVKNGVPTIDDRFLREPGLVQTAQELGCTVKELPSRMFNAKSMWYMTEYGACSSYATLQAGVLKAIGIPTRLIETIPQSEHYIYDNWTKRLNFSNGEVLNDIIIGIEPRAFTDHWYNEVFVGGRWVRLNYATLGQNTYDPSSSFFGLAMATKIQKDVTDRIETETKGSFWTRTKRNILGGIVNNPFKSIKLYDQIGKYSDVAATKLPEWKNVKSSAYFDSDKAFINKINDGYGERVYHKLNSDNVVIEIKANVIPKQQGFQLVNFWSKFDIQEDGKTLVKFRSNTGHTFTGEVNGTVIYDNNSFQFYGLNVAMHTSIRSLVPGTVYKVEFPKMDAGYSIQPMTVTVPTR